MLKLIIYKELREITGTAKFAATFGICSILIILAFISGITNYQTGLKEYAASNAAALQKYETYTEWNRVTGHQIFLPPRPLASLVMGVSNDLGRTTTVSGRGTPTAVDSIYSEQPVFAVFRFLDLEFVFQIILSLFAILFAFDAVNGEKERGTLRLSFANSIPRASYIMGKLTGSFLALALPLLIPILIGVLLLPLTGINLSAEEWIRLGLFIICGLLYLGVFLTLSVLMSCLTQQSSSAFLFLLVIWVFSVLIIPRASVLVSGNMVKVPTIEENSFKLSQLMRQSSDDMSEKLNKYSSKIYGELRQSRNNSPEARKNAQEKMIRFMSEMDKEYDKKIEDLRSRLNENRHNKQVQQEKLAFGISRISPAAVFNLASTTLCSTSLDLKDHFLEQALIYSDTFAVFYREKNGYNVGDMGYIYRSALSRSSGEKADKPTQRINPGEIPEFSYQPPVLSKIIRDSLPDISILILYNLIFFTGAFLSFLRYDLR